jgi:hypothetical protein
MDSTTTSEYDNRSSVYPLTTDQDTQDKPIRIVVTVHPDDAEGFSKLEIESSLGGDHTNIVLRRIIPLLPYLQEQGVGDSVRSS